MVEVIFPRYCTPRGRSLDKTIHVAGLAFAVVGGAVLLGFAFHNTHCRVLAIAIYALGFVAMLAASMAYSFSHESRMPLLRRLDHAGIFLMIAGSYTPFTTHVLTGAWAWGMTIAVWAIALTGIAFKLFWEDLRESISVALYVALGWIVLIAAGPIIKGLAWPVLALLVVGGAVYTIGVVFHVQQHWPYARPIWHGHVLVAACLHWIAVLVGVVMSTGPVTGVVDAAVGKPTHARPAHVRTAAVEPATFSRNTSPSVPASRAPRASAPVPAPTGR